MGPGNRRSWDLHRGYWFLHPESFTMHFWMTILFSGLLALLIFLIAVLDNPYRGKISVSPEPLERVYEQIMLAPK